MDRLEPGAILGSAIRVALIASLTDIRAGLAGGKRSVFGSGISIGLVNSCGVEYWTCTTGAPGCGGATEGSRIADCGNKAEGGSKTDGAGIAGWDGEAGCGDKAGCGGKTAGWLPATAPFTGAA